MCAISCVDGRCQIMLLLTTGEVALHKKTIRDVHGKRASTLACDQWNLWVATNSFANRECGCANSRERKLSDHHPKISASQEFWVHVSGFNLQALSIDWMSYRFKCPIKGHSAFIRESYFGRGEPLLQVGLYNCCNMVWLEVLLARFLFKLAKDHSSNLSWRGDMLIT